MLALMAAIAITLSAYYLTVAKNPPVVKTTPEYLVYLYKPGPAVPWHDWFTLPGSSKKYCGIADGVFPDGEGFGAAVPCAEQDPKTVRRRHKGR